MKKLSLKRIKPPVKTSLGKFVKAQTKRMTKRSGAPLRLISGVKSNNGRAK